MSRLNSRPVVKYFSFIFVFCLMVCSAEIALAESSYRQHLDSFGGFVTASSTTYSETSSISAYDDDLIGGDYPSSGQNAVTFSFAEVGVLYRGFSLSMYKREDYSLRFTNDTFELVYRDKNDLVIEEERRYDILLDVAHVRTSGIKLGYTYSPIKNLSLSAHVMTLEADDLLYGKMQGYLESMDGNLNGDLLIDYNYVEDVIFGRPLTDPASGDGYSLDVGMQWKPVEGLDIKIDIFDLVGEIKWTDAPYTDASLLSSRTYTDEDGNRRRAPMIQGVHGFRDLKQPLPEHYRIRVSYDFLSRWNISMDVERYEAVTFKRISGGYRFCQYFSVFSGVGLEAQSLFLGFKTPYGALVLETDDLDQDKSRMLRLNLDIRYVF